MSSKSRPAEDRPDHGDRDPSGQPLFGTASVRALSRVGVVDIGSNSIRMVVFDGAARSPAYFFNEKVMAGLGQGLAETGRLNPEGRKRCMAALKRFAALAGEMDIDPLTCVATAAVRDAEDGPGFCREVERETGLKLQIVDGQEEARLSAQGVLLGWPEARGLVCDIGGNSMELAEIGNGKVWRRASSQLGPFRLQQIGGGRKAVQTHIRATMQELAARIGTGHRRIYLVGGSWRAIARLDMERRNYPLPVLHEYRMNPGELLETIDWIGRADMNKLRSKTGTSSARMELVPLASQILRELIDMFQPDEIDISAYGIREGLLFEQMPERLRSRDPLIEAARHSERMMSRMPGFGKRLHSFIEPIFGPLPPQKFRLVRAACLLHDTTWRTHPDHRAEACFENVTRARYLAMSHPERIFLGVALLHRYKNSRSGSRLEPFLPLLGEGAIRDAEVLGKAMRFGAMFTPHDPTKAGQLKYFPKEHLLELHLTGHGKTLYGEVVEARFRALCNALKADPLVT